MVRVRAGVWVVVYNSINTVDFFHLYIFGERVRGLGGYSAGLLIERSPVRVPAGAAGEITLVKL